MNTTTALGLIAGLLTTIAYLPQLIKTWKTKSADDISWSMLITLCIGIVLWLVYGSSVHDVPLIAANIVTLIFSSSILVLKIRYKHLYQSNIEPDTSTAEESYSAKQAPSVATTDRPSES